MSFSNKSVYSDHQQSINKFSLNLNHNTSKKLSINSSLSFNDNRNKMINPKIEKYKNRNNNDKKNKKIFSKSLIATNK